MKKTLCQIAQTYLRNQALADSDIRTVLRWFGSRSLYFPTEQEKNNALRAFMWLYQRIAGAEISSAAREQCVALFSEEFSLPAETAKNLCGYFIQNFNTVLPTVIGIEGLDGSGKTVQAEKLCKALRQHGKRVYMIDFPQYKGFFGKEIGQLLSGTDVTSAMDLDEKSMCLWFALDRWQTVRDLPMGLYDYIIFIKF